MPIRTRLTIWYAAVLTLTVVALGAFLVWRMRADLVRNIDSSLEVQAHQLLGAIEDPQDTHETIDLEIFGASPLPPGAVAQVVNPLGTRVVARAGDVIHGDLITRDQLPGLLRPEVFNDRSGRYRVHALRLERSDNVLLVATSLAPTAQTIRSLLVLLAIAIPIAVVLSVAFGYMLARRALRPIDQMTADAAAIGADDVERRLELPPTDDEVGRLGRTLNGMLDRLQDAITEQRRFTADASHELRTPLAIIQSEIDVALRSTETSADARAALQSMREEVVRMSRLVDSLLTLMRADEGGLELAAGEVDLADVARIVRNRFAGGSTRINVDAEPVVVWGDSDRLDQLLTNLIDNALKYAPGEVDVSIRAEKESHAIVEVTDDGPGIPAHELEHVFDRFYRVDKARTRAAGGAGLGLAICREIVRAHRGEIAAGNRPSGGAVFTVRLPLRR